MCDIDSGDFQAIDDIGYCFDCKRKTQGWKDKVFENVKSNESAKIRSDNIKNTCYITYIVLSFDIKLALS